VKSPQARLVSPLAIKTIKGKKSRNKKDGGKRGEVAHFLILHCVPGAAMGTLMYVIYLLPTVAWWSPYSYLPNFR
jgi:hypothetical protein